MKLKKAIVLLTIAIMLLIATACTKQNKQKDNTKVIVNGTTITQEEFDKTYDNYKAMYEKKYGSNIWDSKVEQGKTFEQYLEEMVLEDMILGVIISEEAEKENIVVSEDDFNAELENYKELFGGEDNLNEFLKSKNMSKEFLEKTIKRELLITTFINMKSAYINDLEPTEEQLLETYEQNKKALTQIRASHILVNSEQEALSIINELNEGKNFEDLAKQYSICSSAEKGGDLGYFYYDDMVYELSNAAFSMKIGELSNPVKSDYGYHIIKVTDIKDTFESVDKEKLVYQFRAQEYNNFLDNYIKSANIQK